MEKADEIHDSWASPSSLFFFRRVQHGLFLCNRQILFFSFTGLHKAPLFMYTVLIHFDKKLQR